LKIKIKSSNMVSVKRSRHASECRLSSAFYMNQEFQQPQFYRKNPKYLRVPAGYLQGH